VRSEENSPQKLHLFTFRAAGTANSKRVLIFSPHSPLLTPLLPDFLTHRGSIVNRLLTLLILLAFTASAHAENWPQWRGPNNDGISTEKNIPAVWDNTKNVAWKLPMPGASGATPIVWGDKIFVTSEDGSDLVLICVSTAGEQLWKKAISSNKMKVYRGDEGNDASPSPSTDGKFVYVFVGSGDFACFDFDGNEKWKFNAQERYGKFKIQFGIHNTPVLFGNRLYMQLIHDNAHVVVAIDKATGAEVWKVDRKSDGYAENMHSYASPVMWSRGDDAYLITHGNDYAIAHKLTDGSEIWRVAELNPKAKYNPTLRLVTSPLATPDMIIIPSAKNGPVVCLNPNAKGIIMPGNESVIWRRASNTPDVPSPLIHDGLLYLCREKGELLVMEAKTGKELYNERTADMRHRGSPVYVDGKVILTGRDGTFSVAKAGSKFELLSQNKMSDIFSASPAISDETMYLRGWKNLYAIKNKS